MLYLDYNSYKFLIEWAMNTFYTITPLVTRDVQPFLRSHSLVTPSPILPTIPLHL